MKDLFANYYRDHFNQIWGCPKVLEENKKFVIVELTSFKDSMRLKIQLCISQLEREFTLLNDDELLEGHLIAATKIQTEN